MAVESLVETQLPNYKKHYYDNDNDNGYNIAFPFPAVVSPNPTLIPNNNNNNSSTSSLVISLFTQAINSQKPFLDSLLLKSGAILFRGFPLHTANDFNDVVEAFGFDDLPYVGGAAPRTNVVGRVSTANESPPHQHIPFHHEMALLPEFPSKLLFFCEVEPASGSGGETPIVLSHVVHERMKAKYPDFVGRLEEHGLVYTKLLGQHDDPSSPIGRGWKSFFLTTDKTLAEERAAKLGMKLEWIGDDQVKTVIGPLAGVRYDKSRQRKIWFNNTGMVPAYEATSGKAAVSFGDGEALPADAVNGCLQILEDECVAIPWKKGDVLLIDNLAVLHSRRPCHSPRRVLASLCK